MSNALSVFEKYLGQANSFSTLPSVSITDTNQIIGALQTIDKCLKKILAQIPSKEIDQDLVSHCLFMGENLFDKEIIIAPIQKSFHINNISDLLAKNTSMEVVDFIQEKRQEIDSLLELIFSFLDSQEEHILSSPMRSSNITRGFY